LLDIVERSMHASRSEWLFFRELRVGTGRRNGNVQRLDASALSSLPHTGMKRVCYKVKVFRSDFLAEVNHPLKRRIGDALLQRVLFRDAGGPCGRHRDSGGVRAGGSRRRHGGRMEAADTTAGWVFSFDPDTRHYCMITVPAPWRDTPGPTWQLVAAMLRNQRRELEERPPAPPAQQRLTFA
jgi:hypothetical protein